VRPVPVIRRKGQVEVETQAFGERRSPARDTRLDRADRDVERFGDLGIVEVSDVAEYDRGAEIVGEFGDSSVEHETVAELVHGSVGIDVGLLGGPVVVDADELWLTAALAEFVECRVGGDPVRPGPERRTTVESGQVANDLDQRFLTGVIGVATAARDAATHGVESVVVAAQQLVERVAIAALSGGDQSGVIEVAGDGSERNEPVNR